MGRMEFCQERADRKEEMVVAEYGSMEYEMPVKIEGLMAVGDVNPSVVSEKMLGDLLGAFTASDPSGGLADDVRYSEGGTEEYPDEERLDVGAYVGLNIRYLTASGDPYNQ